MRSLLSLIVSVLAIAICHALTPFESLVQKAGQGDPEALYRMSALYERGYDTIRPDTALSLRLLRRAADAGLPQARNYLGYLFMKGEMLPADPDSARYWITLAADAGDIRAANNIAFMLLERNDPASDSLAVSYLVKAADAGLPPALATLASLCAQGRGVAPDTLRAVELFDKAIAAGFRDAELRLLNLMGPEWQSLPPAEALAKALRYWNLGSPLIAVNLLTPLLPDSPQAIGPDSTPKLIGPDSLPDPGKSCGQSPRLCLLSRVYALLAHAYSHGTGVPYDHRKANEYFARAALLGDPSAQFILAETLEIFPDALKDILPDLPESMTPESLRAAAARQGVTSAESATRALLSEY